MLLMFGARGVNLGWILALDMVTKPVGAVLAAWGLALFLRRPGVPAPF